jgi:hypothetical protein
MKKSIPKTTIILKILNSLFTVLVLSQLVFPSTRDVNAQDIHGKSKMVKADYREKVKFSRDTWIKFPDFDLIFLGKGVYTGGGRHVPITSYYFRIVKDSKDTIIFWSAGAGEIAPIPFEFDGKDYMIEMRLMAYGREGEDLSFKGKNGLKKDELCISRRKKAKQ